MVYDGFVDHKIFCAIDAALYDEALLQSLRVGPHSKALKLGMTFFNANGPQGVASLVDEVNDLLIDPLELFLDLKFHDIPMQVAGAVRSVIHLKPSFLTIHIAGGRAMMEAAVAAAKDESEKQGVPCPKILGITVLTSLDDEALAEIGQGDDTAAQVLKLAQLAKDSGLDGVVCSPQEVEALRHNLGDDFILMVPGVRPAGSDKGDQKRTMRPDEAIRAGATHLVIGRPITQSDDPAAVVQFIHADIERG